MGSVGQLREALRQASGRDPGRRFHQLYDKLYRTDILQLAFTKACYRGGRPSDYVGGRFFEEGERLRKKVFRPSGGTFGDLVVEEALTVLLEPVLLPDRRFDAWAVVKTMRDLLGRSRGPVLRLCVKPDWESSTERIHDLLELRIADRHLLTLLRTYLALKLDPAVLDFGRLNLPRMSGGLGSLLSEYQLTSAGRLLCARFPSWRGMVIGGNEVVLVTGEGIADLDGIQDFLVGLGLDIQYLRVFDPSRETFVFMGLEWRRDNCSGIALFQPGADGVRAIRFRVRELTRGNTHLDLLVMIERVNRPLGEWGSYYRICPHRGVMKDIDGYVRERLARFNAKKHSLSGPGLGRPEVSRGTLRDLGLIELGKLPVGIMAGR